MAFLWKKMKHFFAGKKEPMEDAQRLFTLESFINEGETTVLSEESNQMRPFQEAQTTLLNGAVDNAPEAMEWKESGNAFVGTEETEAETTLIGISQSERIHPHGRELQAQCVVPAANNTENQHDKYMVHPDSEKWENGTTILQRAALQQQKVFACIICARDGEVFNIDKEVFRIGSGAEAVELQLTNTMISKTHASIMIHLPNYYLMDHNSTNGTFLEGLKLEPFQRAELMNGSIFSLADETFQFFYKKG